jgi:hypothetical protein
VCSACGIPTHVLEPDQVAAPPAKFAALRNADCRPYLFGAALAMMADNIEHVITYWVLWQRFHSPALAGFEVISHWVPFLLLHDFVGREELPSAVRLNATFRSLGILFGPVVGSVLLLGLGCLRTGSRAPAAVR